MFQALRVLCTISAAGLLPAALAVPAPQMSLMPNIGNEGDVGGVDLTPTPVATAVSISDSLYGPTSLLGEIVAPSPSTGAPSAEVSNFELVNGQEADESLGLYLDFNSAENPQPLRGNGGQTDPGPRTYEYERLNPDIFAPPSTDSGDVPQAMWPLGLSHNRFGSGRQSGWARQQNTDQLPSSKEFAGVDMRLAPYSYRELHWHTANEWTLVLKGCVRLSAIDEDGRTFIDDICEGDVWAFPAGVPHSIQALDKGCEFLLVFDQGSFSEDATFLASELFLRNPKSILSKNLNTPISSFNNIPKNQLYIFDGSPAGNISSQNLTGPAGIVPYNHSYTYHFSQQIPYQVPGGSIKILDSTTFPISKNFAVALVTIQPGAMRELHWHLSSDEWNYYLSGSARLTSFLAPDSSRTFDFTAGDVGYIPAAQSHYIENVGDDDVIFLEILKQDRFTDISVAQWLALTPRQIVMDTLHLPEEVLAALPTKKTYLKLGNTNLTSLAAALESGSAGPIMG